MIFVAELSQQTHSFPLAVNISTGYGSTRGKQWQKACFSRLLVKPVAPLTQSNTKTTSCGNKEQISIPESKWVIASQNSRRWVFQIGALVPSSRAMQMSWLELHLKDWVMADAWPPNGLKGTWLWDLWNPSHSLHEVGRAWKIRETFVSQTLTNF